MKGVAARKLAVEVLSKVESERTFANLALSNAFNKQNLSERDRAFATALVQGVLRHRDELDTAIEPLSSQPLRKMTAHTKNNLRVAIFQLQQMDDIPSSAVLNTATEIAKELGHAGIGKFTNGVLRAYLRGKENGSITAASTEEPDQNLSESARLAKQYSLPEWLVERWLKNFGAEETNELLTFSQSVPPLTVRACESGIEPEALLNIFKNNGITAHRGELVDACLIIEDRGKCKGPVSKLPGHKEGLFIVQDEAAAFVSRVVDPKPGELIVDLCAAPGGKTINMAEAMEGRGRVIAVDRQEDRLELLKQTRQRVGLTNIEVITADGTTYSPDKKVDRVLLDAPCSGTGVINRRADLRHQRKQPDIAALVELQRALLNNAASMLKDEGILVYSTCSMEPEENEENLEWFLKQHPNFKLLPLTPFVPETFERIAKESLENGFVQLTPAKHNMSGFFIARLQKLEQ